MMADRNNCQRDWIHIVGRTKIGRVVVCEWFMSLKLGAHNHNQRLSLSDYFDGSRRITVLCVQHFGSQRIQR